MKTQFHVNVETNNGSHTSSGSTRSTLAEALAEAFQMSTYYILNCGYPRPTVKISEVCDVCSGFGKAARWRGSKLRPGTKRCPECKGRPSPAPIEFATELHENVESLVGALAYSV
jgi:hypothetical protein